jgi:hypothetical protein
VSKEDGPLAIGLREAGEGLYECIIFRSAGAGAGAGAAPPDSNFAHFIHARLALWLHARFLPPIAFEAFKDIFSNASADTRSVTASDAKEPPLLHFDMFIIL